MQTQCISEPLAFEGFGGRRVEAAFDGGAVTSDAGVLLLREADRAISLIERVAACFRDERDPGRVVHALRTLVGQRIVGIALGYEDVVDHDELRFDPVLALFSDRLERRRSAARARSTGWNTRRGTVARAITGSVTIPTPSRICSSICSSTPTPKRRARSSSTSMSPTIRCTVTRKAASSTAIRMRCHSVKQDTDVSPL